MKIEFSTLLIAALAVVNATVDINPVLLTPHHIDHKIPIVARGRSFGRITNGEVANPGQFPYQVGLSLQFGNNGAWCGGTLISDRWIVTAAHCTDGADGVTVYLGAFNISDSAESTQQRIFVSKKGIFVHELWKPELIVNDISVIKLPLPIKLNDYIQPAALPKLGSDDSFVGEEAIASGWGLDSDKATSVSPVLRFITMPVMKQSSCSAYYFGSLVHPTNICIKTTGGKSICNGDSGGPLVLQDKHHTLIGATSFGIALGCEAGWPGVFTRITSYLDWIHEKTGVANL